MAFSYITEEDLAERFKAAKRYMQPLFESFDEFERIARNKPHPGIARNLPKVTDGTLAALIQEQPKRVIQQVPTGKIEAPDSWLEIVAGYILENEIIPNSDMVASLIAKCWALVSKSLTYGSQPAFVQFINRGEYFGTDFTLPYIRDVFLEPGKLSDRDSNVIFLRAWYTENQIDAIIAKEARLTKSAKSRGETYEGTWDVKVLEQAKDLKRQKDARAQTPTERSKDNPAAEGFIQIVHAFQRGAGATFYSFCPDLDSSSEGSNVCRRKVNKDPRGAIPIHYMYANVDMSNPLGRGAIELSGGLQNLLDSEMQMYQYNRALMLNPPLKKRGNWPVSMAQFTPNNVIDLGTDPHADIEALTIDTTAIANFNSNYGLLKSQLLNLNSSNDNAVSAQSGDPQTSKTQAGVQATQQRLGISDNYMRRQFEAVFEEIIETEINLYFAERHGVQELTVDPETADKLRSIDETLVGPNNAVRIDYDSETPRLKFKADPTSSTEADNQEQVVALQEVLAEISKNPYIPYMLQADGKEIHVGEIYEQLFERFGLKSLDKILTEIKPDPETGQPKAPTVMTPFFDKPSVSATFKDLPPAAQVQLLANGGINIQESDVLQPNITQMAGGRTQNPVSPAYIDQQTGQITPGHPPTVGQAYVDPATGAPLAEQPEHPYTTMTQSLQIKFTDLPEDAQRQFLAMMGITSTDPTPSAVRTATEASNAAVSVARLAHEQTSAQIDQGQSALSADRAHTLAASDAALRVAQGVQPPEPALTGGQTNG